MPAPPRERLRQAPWLALIECIAAGFAVGLATTLVLAFIVVAFDAATEAHAAALAPQGPAPWYRPPAGPEHTGLLRGRGGYRELIFVVGASGAGPSSGQARAMLDPMLAALGPADRFNAIQFNSVTHSLLPGEAPASDVHLTSAHRYVNRFRAAGGPKTAPALRTAIAPTALGHAPVSRRASPAAAEAARAQPSGTGMHTPAVRSNLPADWQYRKEFGALPGTAATAGLGLALGWVLLIAGIGTLLLLGGRCR